MAVTKIWAIHGRIKTVLDYAANPKKTKYKKEELESLSDVIDYAENGNKTHEKLFVSGVNCIPSFARSEMLKTKRRFHKEDGIIAFHGYQSFKPGEVTPELAHEIGIELAERLWGERHEVLIATHLDKEHIHNHFVVNSVSFVDGKKFNACKASYAEMRKESDKLCIEHNLSIIEHPKKAPRRMEYLREKNGQSTKYTLLKRDIDQCIGESDCIRRFAWEMGHRGYSIDLIGNHVTVNHRRFKRPVRFDDLGEGYTWKDLNDDINSKRQWGRYHTHSKIYAKDLFARGFAGYEPRTLAELFVFTVFGLQLIHDNPQCNPEVESCFEEEVLKLDQLIEERNLLVDNDIETREQLIEKKDKCENEIKECKELRNGLRNKLKRDIRKGDTAAEHETKEHIKEMTQEIKKNSRYVKIADRILAREEDLRFKVHATSIYSERNENNEMQSVIRPYERRDMKTKTEREVRCR